MHPIVYFDLETTGLDVQSAGIIQIGAVSRSKSFSRYIMPRVPMDEGATAVTGMSVRHGGLYKGNQRLDTVTRTKACSKFLKFLADFEEPVILVAHYGHNFDVPLLVRDMKLKGRMDDLRRLVAGTVDTMDVFRRKLSCGPSNFKLATVANYLGVPTHGAHDALRDAEILQDVCDKLNVSANEMRNFSKKLP